MKFRITPKISEIEVELKLEKAKDGAIHVIANLSGDTEFFVLKFQTDGTVRTTGCVPVRLGFQLDQHRSIIVTKEAN